MAISNIGGGSQVGGSQEQSGGLENTSNKNLEKMAGDSGLDPAGKSAAAKQLVTNLLEGKDPGKAGGSSESGGGLEDLLKQLKQLLEGGADKSGGADGASDSGDSDDGSDDIMKLLKKLMSGGTLKPDEMKELLSALKGDDSSSGSSDSGSDDNSI